VDENVMEGRVSMTWLLVTWFVYSQTPTSYQVSFSSAAACETARAALMKEAARFKAENERINSPLVSTVCVVQ
jgi:hypothetical protein